MKEKIKYFLLLRIFFFLSLKMPLIPFETYTKITWTAWPNFDQDLRS